jgi:hypothetical protein
MPHPGMASQWRIVHVWAVAALTVSYVSSEIISSGALQLCTTRRKEDIVAAVFAVTVPVKIFGVSKSKSTAFNRAKKRFVVRLLVPSRLRKLTCHIGD